MTAADRTIRHFLLRHVADGDAVLDVGCGNGWAALTIARERPGCLVHGADSDTRAVHRVNQRARRLPTSPAGLRGTGRGGARVHCTPCAAEELVRTFGRSKYDVATSVHALHHFQDPYWAIRNMRNIARRGGRVLLAEFDPDYGETLDDCPRFSLTKIAWLCEDAGLRVVTAERKRPGVLLVAAERF